MTVLRKATYKFIVLYYKQFTKIIRVLTIDYWGKYNLLFGQFMMVFFICLIVNISHFLYIKQSKLK